MLTLTLTLPEYLFRSELPDAITVMAYLPSWFAHYVNVHPRSASGYMSLKLYRGRRLIPEACSETKD